MGRIGEGGLLHLRRGACPPDPPGYLGLNEGGSGGDGMGCK